MDRLAAMETFTAVVEAGSFSAAARRLQIGQPAVSKSIAQLEEHLNARLLLRSTRGLTPTDAGQRFYEHACLAIEEADRAEHSVRESSEGLVGRLRVGAAVTFARLHVIPALGAFLEQHPDLDVEIVMDDRPIDLLEEGVDVALRMGRLDDSAMTARRVASGKRMVVGTKAYFARHGVPRSPAELSQHRAIVHAMRSGGDSWLSDTRTAPCRRRSRIGRCRASMYGLSFLPGVWQRRKRAPLSPSSKACLPDRPTACLQIPALPTEAPPSTKSVCPVMKPASSESRNAIAAAISSGFPKRPMGTPDR
jgi:DNA-binding transcriptional LysR family regulator